MPPNTEPASDLTVDQAIDYAILETLRCTGVRVGVLVSPRPGARADPNRPARLIRKGRGAEVRFSPPGE